MFLGKKLLRQCQHLTRLMSLDQLMRKNLVNKNTGKTDISFRKRMAYKVFSQTSNYDKIIAKWLHEKK